MYKPYEQYLLSLRDGNKYRILGRLRQESISDFLDFSTNDYLNLSRNVDVIKAAINSIKSYGSGSTGSRLLSGNINLYEEFEKTIAKDKNTESALIFSSGFQANISVLSSLLDEKILGARPLVFFDKLNHASLYQAVFLSKPELHRYHHNNMNHLESLLEKYKNDSRPKFIVTETIFGMDGDVAPIEQIVALSEKYNVFLYLDEAHATGMIGPNGYGLSTSISLKNLPHIVMGTFSKAIGSSGGYIASHKIISDFIINKASGFIYSTAPSPASIGGAFEAWKMIKSLEKERTHLYDLGDILRRMLQNFGFNTGLSTTNIIPIILKEEKICQDVKDLLLKEKIIVSSLRPPTVPPNSSRIRIALTANHKLEDVQILVECLRRIIL